jgi:uncharacterized protein (TIGR03643 family)
VQSLSAGTLPLKAFQHYLIQDYLFLIHFARAKALAVLKGESLAAMRDKAAAVLAILDETKLHLKYCAEWGLSEADVIALMRNSLKRSSFNLWRKRVNSGVSQKHLQKRSAEIQRFKCTLQRQISHNKISKR